MMWLPLVALSSVLMYQSTNAGLYYLIGMGVYGWAYTEGEVSFPSEGRMEVVLGYVLTVSSRLFAPFLGPYRDGRIGRLGLRSWRKGRGFDDYDTTFGICIARVRRLHGYMARVAYVHGRMVGSVYIVVWCHLSTSQMCSQLNNTIANTFYQQLLERAQSLSWQ